MKELGRTKDEGGEVGIGKARGRVMVKKEMRRRGEAQITFVSSIFLLLPHHPPDANPKKNRRPTHKKKKKTKKN